MTQKRHDMKICNHSACSLHDHISHIMQVINLPDKLYIS